MHPRQHTYDAPITKAICIEDCTQGNLPPKQLAAKEKSTQNNKGKIVIEGSSSNLQTMQSHAKQLSPTATYIWATPTFA